MLVIASKRKKKHPARSTLPVDSVLSALADTAPASGPFAAHAGVRDKVVFVVAVLDLLCLTRRRSDAPMGSDVVCI